VAVTTTTAPPSTSTAPPPAALTVERLSGEIGAELSGVDLRTRPPDETIAAVRAALVAHKVVFFRDQHLDYETQVAFARRFGTVTLGHPTLKSPDGKPLLEEIDSAHGSRANHWHTDVTFVERPPAFTFLRAVVIPPVGGDTVWANMATAYDSLPADLRTLADGLRIVHTNTHDYASVYDPIGAGRDGEDDTRRAHRRQFLSTVFEAEHPAVRVHPESGERTLMLGGFAQTVAGLTPQASRDLIRILQDYATRHEHTVRWRWRVGDLAIWDNRATQHYAIFDYGDAHRRGERVTVAGPVPVGVDGRPSRQITGDATAYYEGA
jgi:alpha-ketoglutarate-dependent sulfate ester dioxygenase